jgi:hypothetical protein
MSLARTLLLAALGAAAADEVCSNKEAGCAAGEVEDMGLLQFRTEQSGRLEMKSFAIDACKNLSKDPAKPSQCPSGTIVNSALQCVYNPNCPGEYGCVEDTGCQYVNTSSLLGRRVRKTFAIDDVWEQMIGAVEIDQITEKLKNATGEIAAKLQGQLDALKEAFPAYTEIEAKFKEQWSNITAAVSMEELQSALEDAKAKGAASVQELQAKLEELKANIDIDGIKASVTSFWEEHQFELPDLDELTQHLKDLGDKAKSAVQDAWNTLSSSDQVNEIVDKVKQAGQDALDKVNNAFGNAKDAASGWFR